MNVPEIGRLFVRRHIDVDGCLTETTLAFRVAAGDGISYWKLYRCACDWDVLRASCGRWTEFTPWPGDTLNGGIVVFHYATAADLDRFAGVMAPNLEEFEQVGLLPSEILRVRGSLNALGGKS